MTDDLFHILNTAGECNLHDFFTYNQFKRRIADLNLNPQDFRDAVRQLCKALRM